MRSAELAQTYEGYKNNLLRTLIDRPGKSRAISMAKLFETVIGEPWSDKINDTRLLRKLITQLRAEGVPICSVADQTGGGYFIASGSSDLSEYAGKLRARALRILRMEAALRKITLPELAGQLSLDLEKGDA